MEEPGTCVSHGTHSQEADIGCREALWERITQSWQAPQEVTSGLTPTGLQGREIEWEDKHEQRNQEVEGTCPPAPPRD